MSRSRAVSMSAAVYRGDEEDCEIPVEVTGMIEPYFSGNYEEPPSGGGVDDVKAIFYDGKKAREIPLTDDEVEHFSNELIERDSDYEPEYDEDHDDEPYDDYDDFDESVSDD